MYVKSALVQSIIDSLAIATANASGTIDGSDERLVMGHLVDALTVQWQIEHHQAIQADPEIWIDGMIEVPMSDSCRDEVEIALYREVESISNDELGCDAARDADLLTQIAEAIGTVYDKCSDCLSDGSYGTGN